MVEWKIDEDELESLLFRGAPARHTLAVALRYRPASRPADEPLHLQGFGAFLMLIVVRGVEGELTRGCAPATDLPKAPTTDL